MALLDSAMRIDPEAIKPGCERAYAFLMERPATEATEVYAVRWRDRDAIERAAV